MGEGMMRKARGVAAALTLGALRTLGVAMAGDAPKFDAFPADALKLVQEIDCAQANKGVLFVDFPKGSSEVKKVLGVDCRVLEPSDTTRYFAYRIGEEKGLKPGAAYMLAIEYPEDQPRAMFVHNWGADTISGLATGAATGDTVLARYVNHNPESLQYPMTGKMEQWTGLFFLHDRTSEIFRARGNPSRPLGPDDGFWVIVSQVKKDLDPLSNGAAVSKIRLYEVTDDSVLDLPLNLPPEGLPRRYMFWREEMSDGVISMGHKAEERVKERRGLDDPIDWYEMKFKFMKFIGYDTYSTDLLEFGHNQGWDSGKYGGNDWVYQSSHPDKWSKLLDRMKPYGFNVVPYYEYSGSVGAKGYGTERRAERLDTSKQKDYTHISWTEKANVDVTDPDTLADLGKIIDITVKDEADKAKFVGIWLRPRPSFNPIGFGSRTLRRFSEDANDGDRVTRDHLRADQDLLARYYKWWFDQRRAFLEGVRDRVRRDSGNPNAFVLYTLDTSEPGKGIGEKYLGVGKREPWKHKAAVVTDQPAVWEKITADQTYSSRFLHALPIDQAAEYHQKVITDWSGNWGDWDWKHSTPPSDPERYKDVDGVMLSYSFNRMYTVANPAGMDAFRAKSGLAMVRHFALNEHELNVKEDGKDVEPTGYFVADVERTGPYCMAAEARAVANGDPDLIAYLYGNSIQRGYPYYARRFNQAFQALPALPSEVLKDAAADKDVVVREIKSEGHGTWYAVVNNGYAAKKAVAVTLPAKGATTDAATGEAVNADGGRVTFDMYPFELRALRVQ